MTIIAWDGRYLAADSLTRYGDLIADDRFMKIHKFEVEGIGRVVAGFAGEIRWIWPWKSALINEGFHQFTKDDDNAVQTLLVTGPSACIEASSGGSWEPLGDHFSAIGSGADLAIPVLRDGGTAIESAQYAIRHSSSCGGLIRVYDSHTNLFGTLK